MSSTTITTIKPPPLPAPPPRTADISVTRNVTFPQEMDMHVPASTDSCVCNNIGRENVHISVSTELLVLTLVLDDGKGLP